jgi:dolichol-phosphate mannosyltransferase
MVRQIQTRIAVVIPCFKVRAHIKDVLAAIGDEVTSIFVIDDACPEKSGNYVESVTSDPRVQVIYHEKNQGVGGAVVTGYLCALEAGAEVIVKIDGDGQMNPLLIPAISKPVLDGRADYAKGNRFESLDNLAAMPKVRIFGNAVLSIMSKISSGYWTIADPTNGFTAVHRRALEAVNLSKLQKSFFFESDILFRLNIANCVVSDVPMVAVYGSERSNLKISKIVFEFPRRHAVNLLKRIFYRYYLREWNIGTFELPIGLALMSFGIWFGITSFGSASSQGIATSPGQATGSALALILGVQLLLSFLALDVQAEPRVPLHTR